MNYGMLFTAWGVAGVIGPRIGGVLFDKYQNYQMAFYTAAVLAAVALIAGVRGSPSEAAYNSIFSAGSVSRAAVPSFHPHDSSIDSIFEICKESFIMATATKLAEIPE